MYPTPYPETSRRILSTAVAWALFSALLMGGPLLSGQSTAGLLPSGTLVVVRVNEPIEADHSSGRAFMATVERDVMDHSANLAIPKGSLVKLMVKGDSNNSL